MIRSIVVGFDASQQAHDALAFGELLARHGSAKLTAAYVYAFHPIHRAGDEEFEAVLRDEAHEQVSLAAELANDPSPELCVGRGHSPAAGLHEIAIERTADLIVIGSTRHGPLGRVMTRGVPETLLHDAPCAVAVAPRGYAIDPPERLRTIGVGFDGGPESQSALEQATDIARTSGARLEVITALDPTFEQPARRASDIERRFEHEISLRHQLRRGLTDAVAGLVDIDAAAVAVEGPAAGALCTRSRDLDLLVLGSRCYGALRRVLLGSVSTRVLHRAACPVLVVPRTAVEPDRDPDGLWDGRSSS